MTTAELTEAIADALVAADDGPLTHVCDASVIDKDTIGVETMDGSRFFVIVELP